jgi:4-diphosphocytidyl-2C-methyl-D-erythritol kinase
MDILKKTLTSTILSHFELVSAMNIYEEVLEDPKGSIRISKLKKNRHRNAQKKKYTRTNNDLQNIHIKLKTELHEPH